MSGININSQRLAARIEHLSGLTEPERPWERTAFSDLYQQGRDWLRGEMKAVGLEIQLDAAANLIGTMAGRNNGIPPIAVGSHTDTVPSGGRFDGVAGVLAGLEIVQSLSDAGHRLRHPLQVIDFLAEEPNRYGISCVGSRAMIGALTPEMLAYTAPDGSTLSDGIARMGGIPAALNAPLRRDGDIAAYLEMHIEQARVLEAAGEDIGVVTGIAGITRIEVTVIGIADHAGATPMDLRRDAMTGAAEMVLSYETQARAEVRAPMVATVGKLHMSPNASNAVPGRVTFTLEFRSGDNAILSEYLDWALTRTDEIAQSRDLKVKTRVIGTSTPAPMNEVVQETLTQAAQAAGFRARAMPSGAGHDAAYMASIAPAGMVFIPCKDGRSHCPEEFATPDQVAKGAQTLLDAVLRLDEALN